jgi:hypothetical protein
MEIPSNGGRIDAGFGCLSRKDAREGAGKCIPATRGELTASDGLLASSLHPDLQDNRLVCIGYDDAAFGLAVAHRAP